ncbi:hypothetical protein [Gimesia sp.]|uniref:hypothetical protein n=1 Tax=Gimesia sp. TaxID=2024833 RepID=UPI0025C69F5A|nr:hypothetical protein [Gimesia sp.]
MKRLLTLSVALMFVAASSFSSAAEVESGIKVGGKPGAYTVNDCTGPNAGKSLCYRCSYGKRPVVNIFTRDMNGDVQDLITQIDAKVGENRDQKMAAFVVHLTDDADKSSDELKKVADSKKIKNTPLTNYEGEAGPAAYKISKDADITVLMWVDGQVKVNHAFKKGDLSKDKISQIVNETSKILN